ncbi:MAG TPA: 50S ribosomal protein L21 [Chitinispirillaceae bacterium]|nr:50S ribosomal protein L21 [Chitinispirillaceae bacterium]
MYSIIEQGGAQFKVTQGDTISVPLIDVEAGTEITIDRVLLTGEGEAIKVGTPLVQGASVTAKVLEHAQAKKVMIVKRKRRKDYRRVNGHRQQYTKLQIVSINA